MVLFVLAILGVIHRDQRIFPCANFVVERFEFTHHTLRIGVARWIKIEVKSGWRILPGAAIEGDDIHRKFALPKLPCGMQNVRLVLVIGATDPHTKRPQRHVGGFAGDAVIGSDHLLGGVCSEEK